MYKQANQLQETLDPVQLVYKKLKSQQFTEKKIAVYLYHIKEFLFSIDKPLEEITQSDIDNHLQNMLMKSKLNYLVVDSLDIFYKTLRRSSCCKSLGS